MISQASPDRPSVRSLWPGGRGCRLADHAALRELPERQAVPGIPPLLPRRQPLLGFLHGAQQRGRLPPAPSNPQSSYLRHGTAKKIMNLSKEDQMLLWDSLLSGKPARCPADPQPTSKASGPSRTGSTTTICPPKPRPRQTTAASRATSLSDCTSSSRGRPIGPSTTRCRSRV